MPLSCLRGAPSNTYRTAVILPQNTHKDMERYTRRGIQHNICYFRMSVCPHWTTASHLRLQPFGTDMPPPHPLHCMAPSPVSGSLAMDPRLAALRAGWWSRGEAGQSDTAPQGAAVQMVIPNTAAHSWGISTHEADKLDSERQIHMMQLKHRNLFTVVDLTGAEGNTWLQWQDFNHHTESDKHFLFLRYQIFFQT